ncbi:hypothetical protein BV898_12925 [Hypsibius exemplaris]|uniref:Molybdopterin synthase sulfur carrier subunit n=1 Tax=Hypsibius exemplaris TaxID=2072580 RepID=A0A1W0WC54_HYPEX|nr:hypothetical protein BV898_12925 [Hypsibius exemplaris]
MDVNLKFLALAKDLAGTGDATIRITAEESPFTVGSFLAKLIRTFPRLGEIKDQLILAHNLEYLDLQNPSASFELKEGDEIAVLPPVSGG